MNDDFYTSCKKGRLEMVQHFVERSGMIWGEEIMRNSFVAACRKGHFDVAKYLHDKGADIPCKSIVHASRSGNLKLVKFLVEFGVDIHFDHDAALKSACLQGHLPVVQYLVAQGADINSGMAFLNACFSNLQVAEYLLKNGADIHCWNDYAMTHACCNGRLDVVEFLFENGINDPNPAGFYFACLYGHIHIVKFLEKKGAQFTMDSFLGAVKNGHFEIGKLFLEKGLDISLVPNETKEKMLKYMSLCERVANKRKIWAANKIGSWWIPICYRLIDENGELRMAVRSWKRVEKMLKEL